MRGSITQRTPGSWTVQASGRFDDAGKRIRKTRTIRGSRTDAEKALTKLLREVDQGDVASSGKVTVRSYLEGKWLPHVRTRIRPTTARRYEQLMRVHVIPQIGGVKLSALRPHHVQAVLDAMEGAAPASVLQCYVVLSGALKQATRWQLLSTNPAGGVSPPRPGRAKLHVPDASEMKAILAVAAGTPYEVPVELAAGTGMRRGEILGLRWRDVNLEDAALRVTTTLQGSTFAEPKTERSRRQMKLPARTVAVLRRHRAEQIERRLLVGPAWRDLDLVVDRGDGGPLAPNTLSYAFRRFRATVGLDAVRFHDLRHGYATTLLAAGVSAHVVSESLGHRSSAFTMDTYAAVLPSQGAAAAAAIDAALGGSS
jgi:integrase